MATIRILSALPAGRVSRNQTRVEAYCILEEQNQGLPPSRYGFIEEANYAVIDNPIRRGVISRARIGVVLTRLLTIQLDSTFVGCGRGSLHNNPTNFHFIVWISYFEFAVRDGLTDSWAEILGALKTIRASCRLDISEPEMDTLGELIRMAERAVYRDRNSD